MSETVIDYDDRFISRDTEDSLELTGFEIELNGAEIRGKKNLFIRGYRVTISGKIDRPGALVSIVCRHLHVQDDAQIDVSGSEPSLVRGRAKPGSNSGGHGESGLEGEAGENAGDILISVEQLHGNLLLAADGAKGQDGQAGGHGQPGKTGSAGADGSIGSRNGRCGNGSFRDGQPGSIGGRGGNGGNGGKGGKGGNAGTVLLETEVPLDDGQVIVSAEAGEGALGGGGGIGKQGGVRGAGGLLISTKTSWYRI